MVWVARLGFLNPADGARLYVVKVEFVAMLVVIGGVIACPLFIAYQVLWKVPPPGTPENAAYLRRPEGWRYRVAQAAVTGFFGLVFFLLFTQLARR